MIFQITGQLYVISFVMFIYLIIIRLIFKVFSDLSNLLVSEADKTGTQRVRLLILFHHTLKTIATSPGKFNNKMNYIDTHNNNYIISNECHEEILYLLYKQRVKNVIIL
jgi:hypothetical protein